MGSRIQNNGAIRKMELFRKLGEKLGIIEEDKTEKIMQERAKIKETMSRNLERIGLTQEEIMEVLSILDKSEDEIQKQKDLLIGTNINNPEPGIIMKEIFDEIKRLQLKAASDIKAKIAEIRTKKGI